METVAFTSMAEGTKEDYALLDRAGESHLATMPARMMDALENLKQSYSGYQVTRYEHSLQSATRAHKDGRDEEYVATALLHDIGDELAPLTHGEMMGAVLRPYVRPELVWVAKHHGVFQAYYYAHHYGKDRNARDRFQDSPFFDACVEFCEKYDQNCFDPAYESLPAEFFRPLVERVFAKPHYLTGDELV